MSIQEQEPKHCENKDVNMMEADKPVEAEKRKADAIAEEQPSKKALDDKVLRRQIEYYLCDDNLSTDAFFHKKITESEGGWLAIDYLLSCKKVKALHADADDINRALGESPLETKVEDGKCVAVRRIQPLPELKPRAGMNRFTKQQKPQHDGGCVFTVSGIPEDKKWGDVKDILKVLLPKSEGKPEGEEKGKGKGKGEQKSHAKVQFCTAANGEGENRQCTILLSAFEGDVEFVKQLQLAFGEGDDKKEMKVTLLEGDDLKKALSNMPKHVVKKRQDAARHRQKERQVPIHIGEQKFANVNSLRAKVKEILGSRQEGQALRPDAPDYKLINQVIQFHPRAKEGKLEGMTGIKVDKHVSGTGTKCFFIVKADGSCDDISMVKCFQQIESNPPPVPETPKKEAPKAEEAKTEEAPKAEEAKTEEAPKAEEAKTEEAPKAE